MCWHHHLRSPLYKGPSRWLWTDSDSPDVSRQCKNAVCKIKSPLTFLLAVLSLRTEAEGGEIRGFPIRQLQHCIRSGSISMFSVLPSSFTLFWTWCWCYFFSPGCRSFSSPWTNEPSFLGQVNSLSSSFNSSPRMHHLPGFSYSTQPPTYSSYLSSPPPPPPPLSHASSFQPGSFYYGQNQQFHSMSEDRNVVTALTSYIEGACLSLRGEEPVWRPYWWIQLFYNIGFCLFFYIST